MDEAEYCHRLALMYRGKVIALGAPAELKTQSHRAQPACVWTPPRPLDTMRALEQAGGVRDVAVFGGGLHVRWWTTRKAPCQRIRGRRSKRRASPSAASSRFSLRMEDVFVAMIEAEERKAA